MTLMTSTLGAAFSDGTVKVWRDFSGEPLSAEPNWQLELAETQSETMSFSPTADRVAIGANSGDVFILDCLDGKEIAHFSAGLCVTSLAWIDSQRLAVGTGDWRTGTRGSITVYTRQGEVIDTLEDSKHFIIDMDVHPSQGIIGRSKSGRPARWDKETYERLGHLFGKL